AAFTQAITTPSALGQTWDLCGPERLSLAALVRQILDVTGRRRWLCPIPWGAARLQATVLEFLFTRLGQRPSPLTRDQLLMLQEDNIGDGLPADRALGLSHPGFREGLKRYLAPPVPGAEGQHRGPGRVR
ncbi:MAG: hypothetical protein IT580_03555, partial [Verrucomicrobiales bacterium]|nr:hypothetical protein [Verrucomicrobiales bacterium]